MGQFVHIQQFEKPLYDLTDYYTEILRPKGFKLLSNGESFLQFGNKAMIKNAVSIMFLADHYACPEIKQTFNPQQLSGEFATVTMQRTNRQTNLSRDVFGAKSLFYYFKNKLLIASTDLRYIYDVLETKPKPNDHKIKQYLSIDTDDEIIDEDTFFQDIKRVLPGENIIVFPDGIKKQYFWKPKDYPIESYSNPVNFFSNAFDQSIKNRISIKQSGAFLSGGLDSSSVVSKFRYFTNQPLNAYYFDTGLESSKEKVIAREVAEQKKINLHIQNSQHDLVKECEAIVAISASPDTSSIPSTIFSSIFRAARDHKDQIIFSGHGGDNILEMGWEHLNDLKEANKTEELKEALENYFKNKGLNKNEVRYEVEKYFLKKNSGHSVLEILKQLPSISTISELFYQRLTRKKNENWDASKILNLPKSKNTVSKMYQGVQDKNIHRLLENNLTVLSIQAMETMQALSHAFEVTTTYPFLTKEILETSAKIPNRINFNDGVGRGVLRESMKDVLPKAVLQRTDKAGFNDFMIQFSQKLANFYIPEDHSIWKYARKAIYTSARENILDQKNASYGAAKIFYRIISLALWLDLYSSS